MQHRPDIDGVRAVAVVVVLLYHANIGLGPYLRGGYVGVDVFFVISGYLITGIILSDLDAGRFSIVQFWERRLRRILPAVAIVLLACLVAGWFLFLPLDFMELGQSVLAQAMLVSNVYFWQGSGYFDRAAELKPLLHTWSLAVEQQFYLLFPFLFGALKRCSRRTLVRTLLLLCGGSFCLSVGWSYSYPAANFYLLPARVWELSLGSLLAASCGWRAVRRWVPELLSWVGLLAILWAVVFYNRETRFPGMAAVLPCVGAALVIWANTDTLTSAGKLLALRPVVFLGLISYSLYLWHWPLLVFFRYGTLEPLSRSERVLLLLGSVLIAVVSWRFVETPIRKRRVLKTPMNMLMFSCVATVVLGLAGIGTYAMQGLPSRISAEALAYANGAEDFVYRPQLGLKEVLNEDFIELGPSDKQSPIDLLVWGDSHAVAVLPGLELLCNDYCVRGLAVQHSATAPLVGYEDRNPDALQESNIAFKEAVVAFIRQKRVKHVILAACWSYHVKSDNGTERLHGSLLATVSALREAGAKVWILREVPIPRFNVPEVLAQAALRGRRPQEVGFPLERHRMASDKQDPIFAGVAAKFPGVHVLDPTDLFVDDKGWCHVSQNGSSLYIDNMGHLSVAGAKMLRPLFEPIFREIQHGPPAGPGLESAIGYSTLKNAAEP